MIADSLMGEVDDAQAKYRIWRRQRRNARNIVGDRLKASEIAT
jgi:hypothetical protein